MFLTGDQIVAARRLAGIRTQADLAHRAGVGLATVARAELARADVPNMQLEAMLKIVRALEAAGVEFYLGTTGSIIGGFEIRRRNPSPDSTDSP